WRWRRSPRLTSRLTSRRAAPWRAGPGVMRWGTGRWGRPARDDDAEDPPLRGGRAVARLCRSGRGGLVGREDRAVATGRPRRGGGDPHGAGDRARGRCVARAAAATGGPARGPRGSARRSAILPKFAIRNPDRRF